MPRADVALLGGSSKWKAHVGNTSKRGKSSQVDDTLALRTDFILESVGMPRATDEDARRRASTRGCVPSSIPASHMRQRMSHSLTAAESNACRSLHI
jgi:hypothetical protein